MKKNLTDITVVLDRSGSMSSIVEDTIGGFNTFVRGQKEAPGSAHLTLVQFDDQYEVNYTAKDIQKVQELNKETFVPRGMTALYDAIGKTINSTGERLRKMAEKDRPAKVIFVILTDGGENSSREYRLDKIKEMITHQESKYSWEIVYLGANQDAFAVGQSLGVQFSKTMSWHASSAGVKGVYSNLNTRLTSYRSAPVGAASFAFTKEDQDEQDKLLNSNVITTTTGGTS